ncbi:MAG: type II secretion system secretin GspD [Syntrophobacteraceae bacterium]
MRTCLYILAIILVITSISCQYAPQSPVARIPPPASEGSSASMPDAITSSQAAAADKYSAQAKEDQNEVSKKISLSGKEKPPKKVSPIKPVIAPVETGLLSPSTQEIPAGPSVPAQGEKQRIVLNFEKADIAEVTNQIFSDQLKLNYVMDQTLQGRISMYIDGDFENGELLQMVERAYEANGISVVPKKGFYFIQLSQKTGGGLPVADAQLLAEEKGTRPLVVIYRLRFMDPKQATNLITPFLTPGRKVIAEPLTNSLIFVEETDNARILVNLLKTIDINVLKEISMEIVPLSSIAPQDAVQGMESLMGKLGGFKESAIKNSLALMPLNNFGGVLVMAQNPELLKSARQWLQALDVRGIGNEQEIYVYFVQNGLARDIAQIVSSVLGIETAGGMGQKLVPSGGTAARSAFGTTGVGSSGGSPFGGGGLFGSSGTGSSIGGTGSSMGGTGGVAGSSFGSTASRTGSTTTGASQGAGAGARGAGTAPKPGGIFTGEVMIIPDEVNNAIVVRSNAVDYGKIKKTIETLDIIPRAVLIEVMVAEVDLTKDFSYGLQYYFQTHPNTNTGYGLSFGGLSNQAATTTSGTSTSTTPTGAFPISIGSLAGAGVAMSWVANAQNLAFLLSALASKTNVTVLASPTLLATDNKEATITVGGSVPVPTGSYSTAETGTLTNSVFSTIQYAETGVILDITPHINAGGLVRLELEQTIREVGANSTVGANNTAPTFTERNIKTSLLAQNGSTVVIGGIIQSQNTVVKGGIPYLQDIPLLSPLFQSRSNNLQRTELLVAITPHVVDQRGSEAPAELLQKLNNLKWRAGQ